MPSVSPSVDPTVCPSVSPSVMPTVDPTVSPTENPTALCIYIYLNCDTEWDGEYYLERAGTDFSEGNTWVSTIIVFEFHVMPLLTLAPYTHALKILFEDDTVLIYNKISSFR